MNLNELLQDAVFKSDLNAVKELIRKGADVNANTYFDQPIIFSVAFDSTIEMLEAFIAAGADVNAVKRSGLLLREVIKCRQLKACRLLLDNDCEVNLPRDIDSRMDIKFLKYDRQSPLYAACAIGNLSLVKLLIVKGALIDELNAHHKGDVFSTYTALMKAIDREHFEIVRELVLSNANILLKNSDGESAIDIATRIGNIYITNMLLEYTDGTPNKPLSKLMISIRMAKLHEVRRLSEEETDIDRKDIWGNTALLECVAYGSNEVLDMLVRNGANVNVTDDVGNTPLHIAVKCQQAMIVKSLIEYGANIDAQDFIQKATPLMLAIMTRNSNIVSALFENGCNMLLEDSDSLTACEYICNHPTSCGIDEQLQKLIFYKTRDKMIKAGEYGKYLFKLGRYERHYGIVIPTTNSNLIKEVAKKESSGCLLSILGIFLLFVTLMLSQ